MASNAYIPKISSPTINRTVRCSATVSVSNHSNFRDYWASIIKEVDQKLNDSLPLKYPELIHESIRYSLLDKAAKRGPPVMCVAACELFGGHRDAAFPTACALEMVHAASLIDDDLPHVEDAQTRNDLPANRRLYSANLPILAADALFPLGFRHIIMNTPADLVQQTRLIRVITEIAKTVGSTGMAAGRFLDTAAEFAQENKFGELGQCSAVCGGLLGSASDDEIQRLGEYGRAVGILYRVVEDVTEAKAEGKRNKKGKSYVSVNGVEKALELVVDLKSEAKRHLDGFQKYGDKVLPLYAFIHYAAGGGFTIPQ